MISNQYISRISLNRDKVESFSHYPFSIPAIRSLDFIVPHPNVTFFIGENGTGKSTLLEAIAVSMGFNPEGGTRNFTFSTRASHSELSNYLRIAKGVPRPRNGFFFRAESFFNLASEIEHLDAEPAFGPPVINSYGGHSLHEQSHGESFLSLMMNRFSGKGLYLLDEPEAALSPARQLAMLARMHDLILDDSQFIIATHSPILLGYPDALIYQFDGDNISQVNYKDTDHYQITRSFLNNPEKMLQELMKK
ncbi:AAA family ATPase [Dickeya solani]|uniref:AAA family ATPase n=1 Tax=Dickeya solani TaxID=1089444 RepID=A0ABU4EF66_9GAMM|nr:AAA family ATPase [Dickeya solani]MCA6997512.1 AAA family ATPase [Dickeya solani]MCZ0820045.1 AAA family ATPase [Dickeya solani]MDV6994248.1 AAA family ATPase [Dickeya solani]MDV7004791.1 AAA family ATPase [Dickeya solani]MDV7039311.1 AAA family ATPase [Dickeya solani]